MAIALTLAQALALEGSALAQAGGDAVVVEVAGAGKSLSAGDVRSIIADKLGAQVLAPGDPAARGARRTFTVTILPAEKQIIVAVRDASGFESSQILALSEDPASNAEAIAQATAALDQAKKGADAPPPSGATTSPGAAAPAGASQGAAAGGASQGAAAGGEGEELPPPSADDPYAPTGPVGYFPINLSFIYPLAINVGRTEIRTNLDISLLVSLVGEVYGAQGGVVTYTAFDLTGVQASVGALVGGRVNGAQIGGTFAYAGGGLTGLQLAGVFGWSSKALNGIQFAGIASQSYEDIRGAQIAGGVNIARRDVTGAQIAGGINIGKVRGLQLGLVNVSANVEGLQLGLINVARKIDGLQIGLINITESLAGESLGVANILKPGGIHIALWGSNSIYGNAGLKFSSKYTYSILSAALHKDDEEEKVAAGAGLTLGVHIPLHLYVSGLTTSADLGVYRLFTGGFSLDGHNEVLKTRLIVSYELARRLTLFVGGGAYLGLRGDDDIEARFGPELSGGLEL